MLLAQTSNCFIKRTRKRKNNLPVAVGSVFTADQFYNEDSQIEKLARYGVLGVEMETTALYTLAAKYGKKRCLS